MIPSRPAFPPGLEGLLGALRVAGLEVGPRELLRVHHVLRLEPSEEKGAEGDAEDDSFGGTLYEVLRSCLVHTQEEGEAFDRVVGPWAERWEDLRGVKPTLEEGARSLLVDPPATEGALGKRPLKVSDRVSGGRFRQVSRRLRLVAVMLLALILLPGVKNQVQEVPEVKVQEPLSEDLEPRELSTKTLILYRDVIIDESSQGDPGWVHLFTGVLTLFSAGGLMWHYLRRNRLPAILPEPSQPGPSRLPLLPFQKATLELLHRKAAQTLVWSVGRHVSETLTQEIDLESTVQATAYGGGLPELRFAPEMRLREVWLWLDGSAEDPALLERWAGEVAESLSRAGLPVRLGAFDGVPEELQWETGQPFRPREVEAHRQTALVVVLSDGKALQNQLIDERRTALLELLRALGKWPHLVFADFSEGGLKQRLKGFGLPCLPPAAIPAFFGLGRTTSRPLPEPDPGELRAWGAALALAGRPAERATAWALRRELGLEVSPWSFHRLIQSEGAGKLGGGVAWFGEQRRALMAWLAEGSLAPTSGMREGSLLSKALDFWERRLENEAEERQRRGLLEAWVDSSAERYLRMERGLLRLWREPRAATKILWELREGEVGERLRQRLRSLVPRDYKDSEGSLVPLPWRRCDVEDGTLYLLTQLGLGGVRMSELKHPGRLVAGLGLLLSLGLGLVVAGAWEVSRYTQNSLLLTGIEFRKIRGGTFRMGSEEGDPLAFPNEQPAYDVKVEDFWMSTTEITNAEYGKFKPEHPYADKPVVSVSLEKARDFCRSLEEAEGGQVDLPTEAEWEFAARAGSSKSWPFGENERDLADYAWFSGNSSGYMHQVKTRKPNPWGLYDIHGNVWEWVLDCYSIYPMTTNPIPDPGLQSENNRCYRVNTFSTLRVVRGGSFRLGPRVARSAYRGLRPDVGSEDVGFRCVRRSSLQH